MDYMGKVVNLTKVLPTTQLLLNFLSAKLSLTHLVGQGLGKKEFVATINLNVDEFLLPQSGVYITKTIVNDIEYNSVSFLGHRGSTDGKFEKDF